MSDYIIVPERALYHYNHNHDAKGRFAKGSAIVAKRSANKQSLREHDARINNAARKAKTDYKAVKNKAKSDGKITKEERASIKEAKSNYKNKRSNRRWNSVLALYTTQQDRAKAMKRIDNGASVGREVIKAYAKSSIKMGSGEAAAGVAVGAGIASLASAGLIGPGALMVAPVAASYAIGTPIAGKLTYNAVSAYKRK